MSFYVFLCIPMSFYVPGRSLSLPEAPGTLSGRSQDAPTQCLSTSFFIFLGLSMSRDALGASQDALGTLPGRSGTMSFYVFLCPGTLSRRSQDAPRKCLSLSFYVLLCLSMSFMSRETLGASRRLPGRSQDAPRTLRDYVFLCLYMPETLSQPP